MTLGEEIVKIRERSGVTNQRTFSRELGILPTELHRYEHDKLVPRAEMWERILEIGRVSDAIRQDLQVLYEKAVFRRRNVSVGKTFLAHIAGRCIKSLEKNSKHGIIFEQEGRDAVLSVLEEELGGPDLPED